MADRRMLSKNVVESAKFLKMPQSSQNLYFHLVVNADDDGVVEAYTVLKLINANEDDLRVLVAKEFVIILNEDLVSFICHWRDMNKLQADRKVDSVYKELLLSVNPGIEILEKKQRSDVKGSNKSGPSTDNQRTAQCSVVENSIGKDSIEECKYKLGREQISHSQYIQLTNQFSKNVVDQVIDRIINHPYIGCLNMEIISQWCRETKARTHSVKAGSFNDFEQNNYDFNELERVLLGCSG